jgi:hypothetical protein
MTPVQLEGAVLHFPKIKSNGKKCLDANSLSNLRGPLFKSVNLVEWIFIYEENLQQDAENLFSKLKSAGNDKSIKVNDPFWVPINDKESACTKTVTQIITQSVKTLQTVQVVVALHKKSQMTRHFYRAVKQACLL